MLLTISIHFIRFQPLKFKPILKRKSLAGSTLARLFVFILFYIAQIWFTYWGTCCPSREQRLLVSCSSVPQHVIPEGPLEGHDRDFLGCIGFDS